MNEIHPLYLFLDGLAERLRPGAKREAVLSAWAITWEGEKVLIHLAPGTKESTECCRDFIADMKRRGLGDPALVRGSERWRGVTVTDFERKQLERLHEQLRQQHREDNAPAVRSTPNPNRVCSRDRT